MISTERSMSSEVSLCFLPVGGTAWRMTSRPPWRSRPRVGFLCAGDPGIAITATPISAARIRPTRTRWFRREVTARLG
jgi:hypothetical protein